MRVLIVSTPVGPLGSPVAGGVTAAVEAASAALVGRGHRVDVVAPRGSRRPPGATRLIECDGTAVTPAQDRRRDDPRSAPDSVLVRMLTAAASTPADVEVHLAYDLAAVERVRGAARPAGLQLTMSSLGDAQLDHAVRRLASERPGAVATFSAAQAASFQLTPCRIVEDTRGAFPGAFVLGGGIDVDAVPFRLDPLDRLAWAGRIAPEKGIGDALAVAETLGLPIDVCGAVSDRQTWVAARRAHPGAAVAHHGHLERRALLDIVGAARVLLVTPRWDEAFGLVAVEAMACGTPVVSYRRGGIPEVVEDGRSGVLVAPDDVAALAGAVAAATALDRRDVRRFAAERYSLSHLARRWETWLADLVRTPV